MLFFEAYKDLGIGQNEDDVFKSLLGNLKPSSMLWTYFVNWEKVFANTKKIEVGLNILNYLIGKENFDDEFIYLVKEHPEVIAILPSLAVRDGKGNKKFNILVDYSNNKLVYENFDFSIADTSETSIKKFIRFISETGIKKLIVSKRVKNLVDYMIGVEAGLDSNARKNRGGTSMEVISEAFIKDFCYKRNYTYLTQANAKKIKKEWDIKVDVTKSSRKYDFVINTGSELVIVETNFYGSEGSKLKSTAGEYRKLNSELKGKQKFIWLTDGKGWIKTHLPLRDAFNEIDHIFNLNMLEKGILFHIPLNQ